MLTSGEHGMHSLTWTDFERLECKSIMRFVKLHEEKMEAIEAEYNKAMAEANRNRSKNL